MLSLNIQNDNESEKKVTKKQKLVKHRRKNWSKTDISDVEKQIEDFNRQKLAGLAYKKYYINILYIRINKFSKSSKF